jgi:hypothetical protein
MKNALLLGFTHKERSFGQNDNGHDEGDEINTFYVELESKIYSFTFTYSYGSCGSGYTSASYADCELNLKPDHLPTYLHTTKSPIYISIVNNTVISLIQDSDYTYDASVTSVNSIDGIRIVSHTGNGGCNYYSSGIVSINNELFNV